MEFASIVSTLDYARGQEREVRITTVGDQQITGIPTSVDDSRDALEVFLCPRGADDVEIAVSLSQIRRVDLA